jgi:hypothetical protein
MNLSSRALSISVLVVSAAVVIVAGARSRPSIASAPAAASVALPSPLPVGADDDTYRVEQAASEGCTFTDRGFGDYGGWRSLSPGRLLLPPGGGVRADGSYDLLLHFHGAEAVRKEIAPEDLGLVVYALDAGTGSSAYERRFAYDEALPKLLRDIDDAVVKASGREDAHPAHVVVSSWSAGSGASEQIVIRHADRVAALLLLDSLYAGYGPGMRTLVHGQLPRMIAFAERAEEGGAPMFLSYSQIATDGYASSGETATFLLNELGHSADEVDEGGDPFGLRARFEEGHLVVRGYGGRDKAAHCAHLRLLVPALRDVVLPALR